jgi:polyisoprenyl-teichoic acid--peptidoglycan teichoic acid transferase
LPDVPQKPKGLWKRLGLGALVLVLVSASATAVAGFREIDAWVDALRESPGLDLGGGLAEASAGKPQTILLIGSDRRAKTSRDAQLVDHKARADTVILARLDPDKGATALMSLPRDLKVRIPGHRTDRLNYAYQAGGPRLTLETVKELTGLRINHVIEVNFRGFRHAVNAIGCVYADIDRRYFNQVTGPGGYAAIDVPAGYQKLCGEKALQYVRYRHADNDLVRSARQQDFLRQAKQQVGVGKLIGDRRKLVRIFGRHTRSDIRDTSQVLRLLKLAIASAGRPIREVHFEGRIGATYVTASSTRVRELTQQFLGVQSTKGPRGTTAPRRPSRRRPRPLVDATVAGRSQAQQARRANVGFPVSYPTKLTGRAGYVDAPRVYSLRDIDGRRHRAYRLVIRRGTIGEFYGIQGTTWREPPILRSPSEVRRVGGRPFELHYDGDRLRLVAWRTSKGVYWLSNTLLQTLSERQMLAIAASSRSL